MLQLKHEKPPEPPHPWDDEDVDVSVEDPDKNKKRRIRCPKCGYQPKKSDRWSCVCLYSWNTFETAGLCPGCGKQWHDTACLRCSQWSPHKDWYEEPEAE